MPIEDEVRQIVDAEMARIMAPLKDAMNRLSEAANAFVASQGAPLFRRGPGRPPGRRGPGRPPKATATGVRRGPGRPASEGKPCAIVGCKRAARSKGYCSAHYQKRRRLEAEGRLPDAWKENAAPHSVEDLKLPRGRAAHKKVAGATAGKVARKKR